LFVLLRVSTQTGEFHCHLVRVFRVRLPQIGDAKFAFVRVCRRQVFRVASEHGVAIEMRFDFMAIQPPIASGVANVFAVRGKKCGFKVGCWCWGRDVFHGFSV